MSEVNEQTSNRHLKLGWLALTLFCLLGLGLEALHAFKVPSYLDVGHEARRLMLRLAHTHGTLLGLVNLAFAASVNKLPWSAGKLRSASACLVASTWLMPSGFLLGGLYIHDGDPGLGVALTPVGGVLLAIALALSAAVSLRLPTAAKKPQK